jgi:hypothetical protein
VDRFFHGSLIERNHKYLDIGQLQARPPAITHTASLADALAAAAFLFAENTETYVRRLENLCYGRGDALGARVVEAVTGLDQPQSLEARMPFLADDDVIVHGNP